MARIEDAQLMPAGAPGLPVDTQHLDRKVVYVKAQGSAVVQVQVSYQISDVADAAKWFNVGGTLASGAFLEFTVPAKAVRINGNVTAEVYLSGCYSTAGGNG